MSEKVDDWPLTCLQQGSGEDRRPEIKHAQYCRWGQWDEAETPTGADLVKKEIEDGVVVKVSSVPVRSVVWCLSLSFSCK